MIDDNTLAQVAHALGDCFTRIGDALEYAHREEVAAMPDSAFDDTAKTPEPSAEAVFDPPSPEIGRAHV